MNDPSIDNPRLTALAGEEEHIAAEEGLVYAGCSRYHADGTPRMQRLNFEDIERRIAAHYAGLRGHCFRLIAARDYNV